MSIFFPFEIEQKINTVVSTGEEVSQSVKSIIQDIEYIKDEINAIKSALSTLNGPKV